MRISFSQAVSALKSGQVVALPTETVYGLAASLNHPKAVEHIFILKERPRTNPLIIHIADWKETAQFATSFPEGFEKLAAAFWPGPLTCVLPVRPSVPEMIRAHLPTAAFRIPELEITREIIQETGPLVMPSANLSGRPSSTCAEHVEYDFGKDFPILEGGNCTKGVESTILLHDGARWVIGRLGAIPAEAFTPLLGYCPLFIKNPKKEQPQCPGQLERHYAPQAHLYLGGSEGMNEAHYFLGFKERLYPENKELILLGSISNPGDVAENLYQALRQLDCRGAASAWVDMDFPRTGLWLTIAERLNRAGRNH